MVKVSITIESLKSVSDFIFFF